jgi:hypothetical protein
VALAWQTRGVLEGYETFRVVATMFWIGIACAIGWAFYRRGRKSRKSLGTSLVVGIALVWVLTDSHLERNAWVAVWPKSRMESVYAEQCAILWRSDSHWGAAPAELLPVVDRAVSAAPRRLRAAELRDFVEFVLWVGELGNEDLCSSVGHGPFLRNTLQLAPSSAFSHYRNYMIAAAHAEARGDPEVEVSNDEQTELFLPYLRQLGPEARRVMGTVRPDQAPTLTCTALRELYAPLRAMPAESLESLMHAMNQQRVERFTRRQMAGGRDTDGATQ